jgi:hypothetical protein
MNATFGFRRLYIGREKKLMTEDETDEEVKRVHEMFNTCAGEEKPPPGQDVSAMAWLKSKGATDKMVSCLGHRARSVMSSHVPTHMLTGMACHAPRPPARRWQWQMRAMPMTTAVRWTRLGCVR